MGGNPHTSVHATLRATKRETRDYLLQDVTIAIECAQKELERLDFLWGRIRLSRVTTTPAIKADVRVEVVCLERPRGAEPLHQADARGVFLYVGSLGRVCELGAEAAVEACSQCADCGLILEFHGVIQSQLECLATLKDFIEQQHHDLNSNEPENEDVDLYVDIVQTTFQRMCCVYRVDVDFRTALTLIT
ncbi:hypothetical protein FI667_g7356, partial [Globisporangium splendens]